MSTLKSAQAGLGPLLMLAACAPAGEPAAVDESPPAAIAAPIYVSAKSVSTDCTADFIGATPPGFANRAGAEKVEMPARIAGWVNTGAVVTGEKRPRVSGAETLLTGPVPVIIRL